jgi:hypothetical protein
MIRFRRRLPYLVWWNDELDVTVTFSQQKLDPDAPFYSLFAGRIGEITAALREAGIEFDRGVGCDGYDWEWDWSLKGPISIRFRSKAQKPELRKERARPHLIFSREKTDG